MSITKIAVGILAAVSALWGTVAILLAKDSPEVSEDKKEGCVMTILGASVMYLGISIIAYAMSILGLNEARKKEKANATAARPR